MKNKLKKARFFQETFLLANTSIDVILGISFLIFSNADILFVEQSLHKDYIN